MGHIPDNDEFEEYMNASAEEWSKPEEPTPQPDIQEESTNRWGSPIPEGDSADDENRWESEPMETAARDDDQEIEEKNGARWWIIVIIVVVVLCICACAVLGGLELFNVIDIL